MKDNRFNMNRYSDFLTSLTPEPFSALFRNDIGPSNQGLLSRLENELKRGNAVNIDIRTVRDHTSGDVM